MVGRHPKPTAQHLVENTLNATRHAKREAEPEPDGSPSKPKWLKGRAAKLFDEFAGIGYWLTAAESPKLAVWCALTAETERDIDRMTSARIAQWRALGSELGFDPAARTRIGTKPKDKTAKDPAEQYFSSRSGNGIRESGTLQ